MARTLRPSFVYTPASILSSVCLKCNYYSGFYRVVCVELAHICLCDRKDVCNSSYYHHQIGSIDLFYCLDIFSGCVPEVVVPSFSVGSIYIPGKLRFVSLLPCSLMMNTDNRIHNGPKVVLVYLRITLPHYHNFADVSECVKPLKCLLDKCCRVLV